MAPGAAAAPGGGGKLAQLLSSGHAGAAAARAIERRRQEEQEARRLAAKKRKAASVAAAAAARGQNKKPGQRRRPGGAAVAAPARADDAAAAADDDDIPAAELELAAAEGAAYAALVRSMARSGDNAHRDALRRRQQEEGGWSGSGSSGSGSEGDEDGGSEEEAEASPSSSDKASDHGEEDDEEEAQTDPSGPSSSEDEEEEEEDEDDDEAAAGNKRGRRRNGGKAAAAARGGGTRPDAAADAAGSSKHDYWEAHFGTELGEAEMAATGRTFVPAAQQQAEEDSGDGDGDDGDGDLWHGGRWEVAAPPAGAPGPWAAAGGAPSSSSSPAALALPPAPRLLAEYGVRERLAARWREVVLGDAAAAADGGAEAGGGRKRGAQTAAAAAAAASSAAAAAKAAIQRRARLPQGEFASVRQRRLFALLNTYADVLDCTKPYPALPFSAAAAAAAEGGGNGNGSGDAGAAAAKEDALLLARATSTVAPLPTLARDDDLDAVLLHCLNHVAKSADRVKRNNDRAREAERSGDVGAVPRDQGFSRPKVLLLLPTRALAFRVVRRLAALAQRETRADSVTGKERFLEQFTDPAFAGDPDDDLSLLQARWEAAGGGSAGAAAAAARWPRERLFQRGGGGRAGAPSGPSSASAAEPRGGGRGRRPPSTKPAEHRALFGPGLNGDDHFRLGVKLTRGAVRLFAPLEESDVIVASPIALATKLAEARAEAAAAARRAREARAAQQRQRGAIGAGGGGGGVGGGAVSAGAAPPGEADFLSSVEVCVIERADFMLMQNWAHVAAALRALDLLPASLPQGTDVMRVREWALAGHARRYRQTVATASFAAPELLALFASPPSLSGAGLGGPLSPAGGASSASLQAPVLLGGGKGRAASDAAAAAQETATTHEASAAAARGLCQSRAGAARLMPRPRGVLGLVVPQIRQLFERFRAASPAAAADARFEHFKGAVWPRLAGGGRGVGGFGGGAAAAAAAGGGLLLFVPSYFDFVRLRNFLREEDADFAALSEYCDRGEATRARARFFAGASGGAGGGGGGGGCRILLYTERAHFYHRYRVRGVRDVVFYGLPEHAHFYPELLNLLEEAGGGAGPGGGGSAAAAARHEATSTALFCRWDAPALARVVGEARSRRMLADKRTPTFMFC
jgi:U3 small nucleolar RNA-associated protein 25